MASQYVVKMVIDFYGFEVTIVDVERDVQPGSFHHDAPSDHDYYGWDDLEYEVTSVFDTRNNVSLTKAEINEFIDEHDSELTNLVRKELDKL